MEDNQAVFIKTKLDNKGLVKGSKELEQHIVKLVNEVSGLSNKATASIEKAGNALIKQNSAIEAQRRKVAQLEEEYLHTKPDVSYSKEFTEASKRAEQLEKKLLKLYDAREKYESQPGKKSRARKESLNYDIQTTEDQLRRAEADVENLRKNGGRTVSMDTRRKNKAKFEMERAKLEEMERSLGANYDALIARTDKESTALERAKAAFKNFGATIKQNTKHTGTSLKHILLMGLGIRSMYTAVSRMKRYITDGVNNLVQVDDTLNSALSKTKSLGTQLKNSLGVMAAPLIKAVLPYVDAVISKMVEASNRAANFFAVITGQEEYEKAIAVNEDYAASVKKVNGALASFDKLNVIGSNGNATIGQMFQTEKATAELTEGAKKWKEILDGVKENFAGILNPDGFFSEDSWKTFGSLAGAALVSAIDLTTGLIGSLDGKALAEGIKSVINKEKLTEINLALNKLIVEVGEVFFNLAESILGENATPFQKFLFDTLVGGVSGAVAGAALGGVPGAVIGGTVGAGAGATHKAEETTGSLETKLDDWLDDNKEKLEKQGNFFQRLWYDTVSDFDDFIRSIMWSNGWKIPGHATGAVVPPNAPYLAMLGDNKRETEVVSPLSTMKKALSEVLSERGNGGNTHITIELDSSVLWEGVVNANDQEIERTGINYLAR